jgi:hypothetical protein
MVTADSAQGKKFRFVQLYTSKSYENRRSELVNPPEADQGMRSSSSNSSESLSKHALSPRLVDAISRTAQVVWANTKKQEGLIGRSEMRLQTAVGMPVAVDGRGNMCIVVMFSPNNIHSTDDAMEYLQSISQSATSSSIPCLLPVFDPRSSGMKQLPPSDSSHVPRPSPGSLGEGVTARFVSFDGAAKGRSDETSSATYTSEAEVHSEHELFTAPKDTFGIPMLPTFAELGGSAPEEDADVFDEASYGIWTTIMETLSSTPQELGDSQNFDLQRDLQSGNENLLVDGEDQPDDDPTLQVELPDKITMSLHRRERLEEFCMAFLGMSVFDSADVWILAGGEYSDCLRHVMTVTSTDTNELLNGFKQQSEITLVKFWSGAVGRAFSSGNPVWSANPSVFVDAGRATAFQQAKIMTVLAVPVFSGKSTLPTCVVSCYSLVRSGSVPFVLRFVQQALRLLWDGLDNIEPNGSVGKVLWRDIGPSDLGEMAADVEMQQHFMSRKRSRTLSISEDLHLSADVQDSLTNHLSLKLQSVNLPDGETINVPLQLTEDFSESENAVPEIKIETVQNHLYDAIRSIGAAVPFDHVSTNAQGTKRAHIMGPITGMGRMAAPLPPPQPLPSHVMSSSYAQTYQPPNVQSAQTYQQPIAQNAQSYHPPNVQNAQTYQPPNAQNAQTIQPPNAQNAQTIQPPNVQSFQHAASNATMNLKLAFSMAQQAFVGTTNQTQYGSDVINVSTNHNILCADGSAITNGTALMNLAPPAIAMQMSPSAEATQMPLSAVAMQMPLSAVAMQMPLSAVAMQMPLSAVAMQMPPPVAVSDASMPCCLPVGVDSSTFTNTKNCRIQGCCDPAVTRRPYCIKHSGNRLCEHSGCNKCAQGSTRFCIAHGGGRRCTFPGCDKGARDKFFCAAHGGGKRCKADGCNKSAVGGSSLCTAHGGGRRCAIDGCDKSAQSSTKYCVKHGGGKKCLHEDCEKVARGRTQYCAAHGGGVRCKLEGCNRVAIGRLQLCRAHGGGSRKKGTASSTSSPSISDDDEDEVMYLALGDMPSTGTGNMTMDRLASV